MNKQLLTVLVSLILLALPMTLQAATKVVPPIMKVTYQAKLSSEPVLVQSFEIPGVSAEAARDAVIRAARNRTWTVDTLADGDIQAKLVHRSHDSTLTFKVKDGYIEIWSVSYKINKKTLERKEREEPEGWIRNLHKDILVLLGLIVK